MIAIAIESCRQHHTTAEAFEAMLPTIARVASYGFRHVPHRHRQELINDAIALAFVAYTRLVERGKAALAYPTVLGAYAVKQIRDGRQVGCRRNVRDALSPCAQRRKGFAVETFLMRSSSGEWEEITDDRRANPADIACCRIDFRSWLGRLQRFKRQVALRLAGGDTTTEAAQHFKLSLARVSQLRRELQADWDQFQAAPAAA